LIQPEAFRLNFITAKGYSILAHLDTANCIPVHLDTAGYSIPSHLDTAHSIPAQLDKAYNILAHLDTTKLHHGSLENRIQRLGSP
jgi:hypothetical protein